MLNRNTAGAEHELSIALPLKCQNTIATCPQLFCSRTWISCAAHHVSLSQWLGRYTISQSPFSALGSSGTGRLSGPSRFPPRSKRVPHSVSSSCPGPCL